VEEVSMRSDQEQIDLLKGWWRDSGRFIVVGVALGLLLLAAYRGYQSYLNGRAELASATYQTMIGFVKASKGTEAKEAGRILMSEYANTSYALLGGLALARLAVEEKDFATARKNLTWVAETAKDPVLRRLAKGRLARVHLAEGHPEEALAALAGAGAEAKEGSDPYLELRGDILLLQGKKDEAITQYKKAVVAARQDRKDATYLHLKLADLGADEEATGTTP
jgi:predicted negative regulator of RcsB-dependent stress response